MAEPSWTRDDATPATTLEENWLFHLRRERFRSRHSGKSHDFFVLHLADAVNVVALTPQRRILLVEQFRAGSARDSLETPGGLVDPGEDPLEAGARELLEETGYAGDSPILLGSSWANPSILSSRITTILIRNARLIGAPKPDEREEVRLVAVPATQIPSMIARGEIGHALAVQGLMAWMIAEIPDNPLSPGGDVARPGQFRIASMMMLVAISAVVFGIIANLGVRTSVALTTALSLPISAVVVNRLLDPPARSVLLRGDDFGGTRKVLRLFAIIGMTIVIAAFGAMTLSGVFGRLP